MIKLTAREGGQHVLEWPPTMSLMTLGTSSMEFRVEFSKIATVKVGDESRRSADKGTVVAIVGDDRKEYEFKMKSEDDAKTFIRGVSAAIKMDKQALSQIIKQN